MSVTPDREAEPAVQRPAAPPSGIANPAPLGLAAFALTTFLLSAAVAHWTNGNATGGSWLGYALAYGGIVQLLAGMWEFRNNNVFGAVAFSTYGAFWIGLWYWARFVSPGAPVSSAFALRDQGWIFLAFLIFNTYMLILSAQLNRAIFAVFLTLELTEFFGFIGLFASLGLLQFAGYVGIVTAFTAWYASFAILSNDMGGRIKLPTGKPLI
jgi:succinate-acetate transporter protein